MVPIPDPPDDPGAPVLRRPPPPRGWRERVEHLADATGTTPLRILAGGGAAVVALAVGLWVTRPPAAPPESTLPFATTTLAAAGPSTSTEAAFVVVHVAGAVLEPGVRELPTGARVIDAVEAAGGLTPDADPARVNLAALLQDGERVYIPTVGEPPPALVGGASDPAGAPATGPVDLNTADVDALDALPGIGPATAAAIVEHRDRIGGFTSVDQLLDVRGIGEAKLEALRDLVTV